MPDWGPPSPYGKGWTAQIAGLTFPHLLIRNSSYTVNITTVNPYVSWAPRENLSLWGAVGYGRGDTKLEQDGDSSATRDGDFTSIAGGGRFEV